MERADKNLAKLGGVLSTEKKYLALGTNVFDKYVSITLRELPENCMRMTGKEGEIEWLEK